MIKLLNLQATKNDNPFSSKNETTNMTVPKGLRQPQMSYADYSVNNLKANFLMQKNLSFKGGSSENLPALYTPPKKKDYVVNINDLSESERLNGDYYKDLSKDLAILLKSEKNVFLEKENGASGEIFADSFLKNIQEMKHAGKKVLGDDTEVIYISNIRDKINKEMTAGIAKSPVGYIEQMITGFDNTLIDISASNKKNKVVFIDNFDKIGFSFQSIGEDINAIFKEVTDFVPNISIVGIANKKETDPNMNPILAEEKKKREFKFPENMHKLGLSGLSVTESTKFLNENPNFLKDITKKYEGLDIKITPEAIKEASEKSAGLFKEALPLATQKLLDIAIASKVTDAAEDTKAINIGIEDINDLVNSHAKVVESVAGKNPMEIMNNIETRMNDLAGLHDAKEKIEDIFDYMTNPKEFLAAGRKVPGGLLFTGPPGTGKTEMARAIAGEAKERTGKEVPFFQMTNFGNNYINSGKMAVEEAYANARKYCEKVGAEVGIIFIDEADQICRKISNGATSGGSEDAKTTDALKVQMDGFTSKNSKVKILTIAATNHPEVFDDALLRPSRLRQIEFKPASNKKDIYDLLSIHSRKKPFASEASKANILNDMATMVKGLNGDQMTQILDEATRTALKRTENRIITKQDITDAFITTLFGAKTESDSTLADRMLCSIHEAGHAEANVMLKNIGKLMAISNEERGHAGAATFSLPNDSMFHTFDSVVEEIACLYGGGEAEKLIMKSHGSGVSNDYSRITGLVEHAIKGGSLGIYTPQRSFYDTEGKEFTELSRQYAKEIKKDGEIFTETAQRVMHQIVKAHKSFLVDKYLKENEEAIKAGNEGRNYLAEEYIKERTEWLTKTGEIKAEPVLENGIEALKSIALTDKFWAKTAKVKDARNFMSDGVEKLIGLSQDRKWLENKTKTAEDLSKKIDELVHFAENGADWLDTIAEGENVESKFKSAINEIVKSAKETEIAKTVEQPGFIKRIMTKVLKAVA